VPANVTTVHNALIHTLKYYAPGENNHQARPIMGSNSLVYKHTERS